MMPVFTAEYPILAKVQKPGGVTVLSAVGAGDVPNKPTYAAGTVQMTQLVESEVQEAAPAEEAVPVEEVPPAEEAPPVEEEHPSHAGRKPKHRH
jgi:hypothetical protein